MRQLKYIKFFEAFDSVQIAKTLKFVKKSDKSKFMNALESITKSIDAPLSALNDDNFQYLPYKKAIAVKLSVLHVQVKEKLLKHGVQVLEILNVLPVLVKAR
jgi:predicted nuclease with RNAse H fold